MESSQQQRVRRSIVLVPQRPGPESDGYHDPRSALVGDVNDIPYVSMPTNARKGTGRESVLLDKGQLCTNMYSTTTLYNEISPMQRDLMLD